MNWDAIGAVGEIIGAVAVLLSLLYLSSQIRQNTKSTKSASYQAAIASMSEFSLAAASDEHIARVSRIITVGDIKDLSEDELAMGSSYLTGLFRNFENFYYQHQTGVMEDHLWKGMRNSMVGYYSLPNVREWWSLRKVIYSNEFALFLESQPNESNIRPLAFPARGERDA